jgi:hypothetical protein
MRGGKIQNLAGQRFGRLVAVERVETSKGARWICRCDCGRTTHVVAGNLKGSTRSCGCLHRKDLTDKRFGKLVAVECVAIMPGGAKWKCRCDCGRTTYVQIGALNSGNTKSCGCMRTTHGAYGTPSYISWQAMKTRCLNPDTRDFKDYGGRGITVCKRWQESFPNFLADMGLRPLGTSIDRKKNHLGYYKSNCRWATPKQQRANQRPPQRRMTPESI